MIKLWFNFISQCKKILALSLSNRPWKNIYMTSIMSVWWKIKIMNAQTTYWEMLFSELHMHLGNKQKREHWLIFSRFFYELIFSGWLLFNKLPLRKIQIQLIFFFKILGSAKQHFTYHSRQSTVPNLSPLT